MYFRKALFSVLTAVFLLSALGAGSVPALAQPVRNPGPALSATGPAVPIDMVPVQFVRRALLLIAEVRNDKTMAPNWANATLNPEVRELYRPDLKEVAYYEFRVLVNKEPAGFIIVSTGPHDFLVPHWSNMGISPTADLDMKAAAKQFVITKYYRLDALTYAGEDMQGNFVSNSDSLGQISGIDPAVLNQPITLSQRAFMPPAGVSDDKPGTPQDVWPETQNGPLNAPYEMIPWSSWQALKDGYSASYGTFLTRLSQDAAQEWSAEAEALQFGEVLSKGDVREIDLLCPEPVIVPTGDGVKMVTLETIDRSAVGLGPTYRITVLQDEFMVNHPLDISITCPGAAETFKYVITAPTHRLFLPSLSKVGGPLAPASAGAGGNAVANRGPVFQSIPVKEGDWGPWSYYWVHNGTGDTSTYNQIATSTCYTGCGATAWAMLFGWADHEAASWSYWAGRWGIYRENGGYGINVVAPLFQEPGIVNITFELASYIHTFCWGSSGATKPWDMGESWRYLAGRSGTVVDTHYNVFGITEGRLRDYAVNSIRFRGTPAIIGTGWLSHYPLAMGYAWRSRTVRACGICWWDTTEYSRWFWVNQGWGGSGNGWVSADTWFAGEVYP